MKSTAQSTLNILLVDDNEDDVLLTKHAFKNVATSVQFHIATDGLEALSMLRQEPPTGRALRPDVILLDLNMPRMDGRQLLAELKNDEHLQSIPTIILTTSDAADDVCNAYWNHANAYMTKPIDLGAFSRKIQGFAGFWLANVVVLPSGR